MNIDPLVEFFKNGGISDIKGKDFGFKYEPIFNFSIFDNTKIDNDLSDISRKFIFDINDDESLEKILKKAEEEVLRREDLLVEGILLKDLDDVYRIIGNYLIPKQILKDYIVRFEKYPAFIEFLLTFQPEIEDIVGSNFFNEEFLKINPRSKIFDENYLIEELKNKRYRKIEDDKIYGYVEVNYGDFTDIYSIDIHKNQPKNTFMFEEKVVSLTIPKENELLGNGIELISKYNLSGIKLNRVINKDNLRKERKFYILCRTKIKDIIRVDKEMNYILTKKIEFIKFAGIDGYGYKR